MCPGVRTELSRLQSGNEDEAQADPLSSSLSRISGWGCPALQAAAGLLRGSGRPEGLEGGRKPWPPSIPVIRDSRDCP